VKQFQESTPKHSVYYSPSAKPEPHHLFWTTTRESMDMRLNRD
jgi:hypothetical protein